MIVMTQELEEDIKEIRQELNKLDKRLTISEASVITIEKGVAETKVIAQKSLDNITKIEIKQAYAAGGFAVAVILAQILIKGIFH